MLIVVVAVEAEARAIGALDGAQIVTAGVGRTNAACATTEAIINAWKRGGVDAVISAGVAGSLPPISPSLEGGGRGVGEVIDSRNRSTAREAPSTQHNSTHPLAPSISGREDLDALRIGDVLVASSCVYAEEGIITAKGFAPMESLGFPLGDFPGNAVPVDEELLDRLSAAGFRIGPIATVATCSGTDAAAREVARRTGALAEAMEGAAVVHAARRLKVPAIEIRAISNTCGDRASQIWDLHAGIAALGGAVGEAARLLTQSRR